MLGEGLQMWGISKAKVRRFFTTAEKERIVQAIQAAEAQTSGEIRVHVESSVGDGDLLERAKAVFQQLGMDRTELHNGVLIYLAVADRKFAIIGDAGIDRVVPANFWEETKELLRGKFSSGRFVEGIIDGVASVGEHLKTHFPYCAGDINELTDEISEGK
jgi:uncharacterized membrane protein